MRNSTISEKTVSRFILFFEEKGKAGVIKRVRFEGTKRLETIPKADPKIEKIEKNREKQYVNCQQHGILANCPSKYNLNKINILQKMNPSKMPILENSPLKNIGNVQSNVPAGWPGEKAGRVPDMQRGSIFSP